MARILIVGGGCRGRRFATQMVQRGHALRVTTRSEAGRAGVEATGAECWIGTPDRLATLRGALDSVTVACWMLAGASGAAEDVGALHASRLEFFLSQAIDTTVRGFVYDAWPADRTGLADLANGAERTTGAWEGGDADCASDTERARVSGETLLGGARIVRSLAQLNAIPAVVLAPESANGGAAASGGADGRGGDGAGAGGHAGRAVPGAPADEAWIAAASGAVDLLLGADSG